MDGVSLFLSPLIKKAFDKAIKSVSKLLIEKKLHVNTTDKQLENCISDHIKQIANWADEVSFKDLSKAKSLSRVYIDVDISLMPQQVQFEEEVQNKISSRNLFDETQKHIVILGQPGAGKTTLMKFICQSIMTDESFYPDKFKLPQLIRLRDHNMSLNERNPISSILFGILGLIVSTDEDVKPEDVALLKQRVVFSLLEELRPIVILDGYDEISDNKNKERVLDELKLLTLGLNEARIILTSRSSDFNYSLDNVDVLEICPLSDDQIVRFSNNWLQEKNLVEKFLIELKHSPFIDTAIRPLTLAHLCAIFERSGRIPEKPKTVYRKIVNLLLEEWDEQRGVKRISGYGQFEVDRKMEFLARLAYELTCEFNKTTFSDVDLRKIYNAICFDFSLESREAKNVIIELETHTGLIMQAGYKKYEFAHKSIQEFLCSEHMVKLPTIPGFDQLYQMPNELAIAITISSNPSQYFAEVVLNRLAPVRFFRNRSQIRQDRLRAKRQSEGGRNEFITTFVNRLVLEKPDFNNSDVVGLAIIVLYTLFKETETSQLQLFNSLLPIQFEHFISLAFLRNKKFKLAEYYDIKNPILFSEEDKTFKLNRKQEAFRYNDTYALPPYVYIKKSFIAGFELPQ
jgi:GTPase SAR1 family protein